MTAIISAIAAAIHFVIYAAIVVLALSMLVGINVAFIAGEWKELRMSARIRFGRIAVRSSLKRLHQGVKLSPAMARDDHMVVADRVGQEVLGL